MQKIQVRANSQRHLRICPQPNTPLPRATQEPPLVSVQLVINAQGPKIMDEAKLQGLPNEIVSVACSFVSNH